MPRIASAHLPLALAGFLTLAASSPPSVGDEPRLMRSLPAADATVAEAPREVRLWFSEAPERAVSRIRIDRDGVEVETGPVVAGDANDLRVSLVGDAAGAGRYTVTWRTAGADLVPARGRYSFRVGSAPSPSPPAR